jgi:hypothetical protein
MKRLFRLVIAAMMLTMMSTVVPTAPMTVAQDAAVQPVGMVSGAWRMMAWQLAFAPEFPDHGLKAHDGGNWAVLIADMTNTGAAGGVSVADVKLGDTAGDPARSVEVSHALGFDAIGEDGVLPVAENGTARVAVVFAYAGDPQALTATIGDQSVAVTSIRADAIDASDLPEAPAGMQLEIGTIQALPNAGTLSLTMQQTGEAREVTLAGIKAPPEGKCYGAESVQLVNDTTGGMVWVESVPGVDAPTVWYNNAANGTFGLLSHALVSAGAADVAGDGVYTEWLAPIADRMESQKTGLWENCKSAEGAYINPPTPTPVPTPSAEEIRAKYSWVDTRELITRPFQFKGQQIAVSGEVFNIQVDQDGTFMQIWVDTPSGREAVVVGYLGNQTPGLYEGMWVSVYGVGAGTVEGTNAFGGSISQPVILADIVDY